MYENRRRKSMNYIKRAFLNLTYRKRDNILLILVFAVIATLILSSLCIRAASAQSCRTIREQLGGTVTLRHKPDAGFTSGSKESAITPEMSARLARLTHVKTYNNIASTSGHAVDFKAVGTMSSSTVPKNSAPAAVTFSSGSGSKKPGQPSEDIYVMGVTSPKLLDDFASGKCRLTQGRFLQSGDRNKPVAMIEETLAKQDNLKAGDKIVLESTSGSDKKIAFTIIGIYENTAKDSGNAQLRPILNKGNKIYVSNAQCLDLADTQGLDYSIFTMDDPSNIPDFEEEAKSVKLPSDCELDAKDGVYQRMSGPLRNLNLISAIMLFCVLFAGALILSLIVVLSLKGRKYEIGVLLSIGEKKARIMAQMALEILVPVLIAFSLSAVTGNLVTQQVGSVMLSNEVQSQKNITAQTANDAFMQEISGQSNQPVNKINVAMTWKELLALYLAGVVLVLISAAVPVVAVMRYHPSEILIKIE